MQAYLTEKRNKRAARDGETARTIDRLRSVQRKTTKKRKTYEERQRDGEERKRKARGVEGGREGERWRARGVEKEGESRKRDRWTGGQRERQ